MFAHQTSLGIQGDVVPGSSLSRVCVCALICLLDDGIRAACFSREHYHIIIGRVLFYHTHYSLGHGRKKGRGARSGS